MKYKNMDIAEELVRQALNSILHGSTQIISKSDGYGGVTYDEIRVGDLRLKLVEKLAEKLVATPEFKQHLDKVFSPEVITKLRDKMIEGAKYQDLPYDVKNKVEKQMKDTGITVKSYKLVVETVTEDVKPT